MGKEIQKERFTREEFIEFSRRLDQETQLLTQSFRSQLEQKSLLRFSPKIGFELEAWLTDKSHFPAPMNEKFLYELGNSKFVHELSRFNFEINSDPHEVSKKLLFLLEKELQELWQQGQSVAQTMRTDLLMMGMLPTLSAEDLCMENMSPSERYHALNEQVMAQRHGQPLQVDIKGRDYLKLLHQNVMLESAATSLQIHWDLLPQEALAGYNASLLLSAPMVAMSSNSPFLFGKSLWQETRVPLFEQAVRLKTRSEAQHKMLSRVSLGSGFLREGFWELFQENLQSFPPLLPILYSEEPKALKHLCLHNGTVWRWNRPLVQRNETGVYQLRLEHRAVPAGPTPRDIVANIAGFLGLMQYLTRKLIFNNNGIPENITFSQVRENFYLAAEKGLQANIHWWNEEGFVQRMTVQELWINYLLPQTKLGLEQLGVAHEDIQFYIEETLAPRIQSGQTGAVWQQRAADNLKGDLRAMTAHYLSRQKEGKPVHQWSLPC